MVGCPGEVKCEMKGRRWRELVGSVDYSSVTESGVHEAKASCDPGALAAGGDLTEAYWDIEARV